MFYSKYRQPNYGYFFKSGFYDNEKIDKIHKKLKPLKEVDEFIKSEGLQVFSTKDICFKSRGSEPTTISLEAPTGDIQFIYQSDRGLQKLSLRDISFLLQELRNDIKQLKKKVYNLDDNCYLDLNKFKKV